MVLGIVTGSVPMLFSLMLMQGITLSMWRSFLDRAIPSYKPGDLRKGLQTTLISPASSTEAPVLPNLSSFESLNLQEAASNIKQSDNDDQGPGKGDNVLQSLQLLSKLDPKMLDLLNKMTTQGRATIGDSTAEAGDKEVQFVKDGNPMNLLSQLQSQDPVDYASLQQQLASGQFTGPDGVQYVQYDPNTQTENGAGLQNDPGGESSPDGQQQYILPDGRQVQYVEQIDPNYYQQQVVAEEGQVTEQEGADQQTQLDPGVRYQYVDEVPGKEGSTADEESQLAQYQLSESVDSESGRERPPFIIGSPIPSKARRHRTRHPQHRTKRRRKVRRRPSRLSSLFRAKREVKTPPRRSIPVINVDMKQRPRKKSRTKDKKSKAESKTKHKYTIDKESIPTTTPYSPVVNKKLQKPQKPMKKGKKRRFVKFNTKKKTLQTSESNRIQVLVPSGLATTKRLISLQSKKIQIDDPNLNTQTNCSFRRLPESDHAGMSLLWNDKDGWSRPYSNCIPDNSTSLPPSSGTSLAQNNHSTSISTIALTPTSFPIGSTRSTSTRIYRGRIPPPTPESEFEIFPPITNAPTQWQIPQLKNPPQNTTKSVENIEFSTIPSAPLNNSTESGITINNSTTTLPNDLVTAPPEATTSSSTTTALPPAIYINVTCAPTNGSGLIDKLQQQPPQSIKLPEHIVINLINNLRTKSAEFTATTSEPTTTSSTTTSTTTTLSSLEGNPLTILFKHLREQQLKQQHHQTKSSAIIEAMNEIQSEDNGKGALTQKDILAHVLTTINSSSKRITDSGDTLFGVQRQEANRQQQQQQQQSQRSRIDKVDKAESTTSKNELFRQDILKHVLAAINASRIEDFDLHQMNNIRDILPPKKQILTTLIRKPTNSLQPTSTRKRTKSAVVEIDETTSSEEDESDNYDDSRETEEANNRFKRVCYYLLNGGKDGQLDVELLQLHICSHLIVGYAKVHPNGLVVAEKPLEDTEKYRRLGMLKARNPHLKVLLSIGDLGGATFSVVASSNRTRRIFADSVLDLCREFQFDGVDIDWEFPAIRTGFKPDRINLIHLLVELRQREEQQWRNYNNDPFIISMAVGTPLVIASTSYIIPALARLVDFVNLMSYDFHYYRPDRPFTGHHAPLYPRSSDKAYYSTLNVAWSATYWASRGMPLKKIIVGVPTYARTYSLVVPIGQGVMNAPASGVGLGGGKLNYTAVCDFIATPNTVEQFDQHCQVPYAYRDYDWIAFENEMSVAIKTQWVVKTGMGGVVTFALNFDDSAGHCRRDGKRFPLQKTISNLLELASIRSYKQNSYVMTIRN